MSVRERLAERVFDALLRAYPADFRAQYAKEMTQLFRDQRRIDVRAGISFWAETIWDVARSAPALRAEALRAGSKRGNQPLEGTMRPMAILAMLVGVIQVVNAAIEGWAGRSQIGSEYSLAGVALGLVAAALLVAAGVALLRRGWDAVTWARVAAVACLMVVALIRLVQPWMSVFGMLLGIGFPVALLLFLYLARRGGPSMPRTA
jgi:hypothetical protein